MANEFDLDAMRNIAKQRAEDISRKATDIGGGIEDKFDEVLKIASPERQKQLLAAKDMATSKNVPLGQILSEMMVGARNKLNPLSKVENLAKGFGKVKAVPVLGGIAAGLTALNSGDAAAAGMDYVVPGGVEEIGEAPGEQEWAKKQQEYNQNLQRNYYQNILKGNKGL